MRKIILISLLGLVFSGKDGWLEWGKDSFSGFEFPNITLTLDLASPTKEQDSDSSFDYNGGFGLEFPVSGKITIGASYDITPFKYLGSDVNFLTLYGKYELFKMGYKLDRDKAFIITLRIHRGGGRLDPLRSSGPARGCDGGSSLDQKTGGNDHRS